MSPRRRDSDGGGSVEIPAAGMTKSGRKKHVLDTDVAQRDARSPLLGRNVLVPASLYPSNNPRHCTQPSSIDSSNRDEVLDGGPGGRRFESRT